MSKYFTYPSAYIVIYLIQGCLLITLLPTMPTPEVIKHQPLSCFARILFKINKFISNPNYSLKHL